MLLLVFVTFLSQISIVTGNRHSEDGHLKPLPVPQRPAADTVQPAPLTAEGRKADQTGSLRPRNLSRGGVAVRGRGLSQPV